MGNLNLMIDSDLVRVLLSIKLLHILCSLIIPQNARRAVSSSDTGRDFCLPLRASGEAAGRKLDVVSVLRDRARRPMPSVFTIIIVGSSSGAIFEEFLEQRTKRL